MKREVTGMKSKGNSAFDMTGFGKVFGFTLRETFKNKAYRTSFIAMVVVMTIMGPMSYLGGRSGSKSAEAANSLKPAFASEEDKEKINIYLVNDTDIKFETGEIFEEDDFYTDDMFKAVDKLPELSDTEVGFVFTEETVDGNDTYVVKGIISDDSQIMSLELDRLADKLLSVFQIQREEQENSEEIQKFITTELRKGEVDLELDEDESAGKLPNEIVIVVTTIYSLVVLMLISLTSSYIISSINEEKNSKLVETLLVSVKPMALVMGKIVAMLVYVMLMFFAGGVGAGISNTVVMTLFPMDQMKEAATQMASNVAVSDSGISVSGVTLPFNLGTINATTLVVGIIAVLVNFFVTFFIFAMLAGIFGSACVKKEDVGSANLTLMMVAMAGYFAALAFVNMSNPILDNVLSLIPFVSSFVAPIYLLAGRIGIVVYLISFAIQVAFVFFLIWLCARVYKKMLLNDSEKFSLGLIFRAAGKEA